ATSVRPSERLKFIETLRKGGVERCVKKRKHAGVTEYYYVPGARCQSAHRGQTAPVVPPRSSIFSRRAESGNSRRRIQSDACRAMFHASCAVPGLDPLAGVVFGRGHTMPARREQSPMFAGFTRRRAIGALLAVIVIA